MKEHDFPALYRSADDLSLVAQGRFFLALKWHLGILVFAAFLTLVDVGHRAVPVVQLIALLGALGCSIYLFAKRPDRLWYGGRAVAESIKTITWRYVCRAEPFHEDDAEARSEFGQKLKAIVEQNRGVCQSLIEHLDGHQITPAMDEMRAHSLEERKETYATTRIADQLSWYAKKAKENRNKSEAFFWALIAANCVGVLCAILRIALPDVSIWPTDVALVVAASLLSWMQARRFSELAASYALAAHEIGLVREQSRLPASEREFSDFVGDAENAFSREHTQWVARRDV